MFRIPYFVPLLLSVGLPGLNDGCGDDPEPTPWEVPGVDYSAPGLFAIASHSGELDAPSGCTLPYTSYHPEGGSVGPLVVLSHGFQRNSSNMTDLAQHLASWGFHVVTPDLCHSTAVDNDPTGDANDLIALAASLGAEEVAYLGHSAGGMRSVLAGEIDPNAMFYHGLDMVDAGDLALNTAPTYPLPAAGSLGEPSSCNANSNGIAFYEAAPAAIALKVTEADHCDFEGPTDALCTSFCAGTNALFDEATIRKAIVGLATSYVLWQSGVDASAAGWWSPEGEAFGYLTTIGLVTPVVPMADLSHAAAPQGGLAVSRDRAPATPLALDFLKADRTRIIDSQGNTVQLRGVALGGWLYHETWITAVDFNLHNRLAALGDRDGIGEEVRQALYYVGPFNGGSSDTSEITAYLQKFEDELSIYVTADQAGALTTEAHDYPLLYDDSDRPLLTALEDLYGQDGRDSAIGAFQDNWITEGDIKYIRDMGMNMVRVPMGYRALMNVSEDTPLHVPASFKEAAFQRIDRLLSWCETYGVYAVLDIQEAPGGQNNYSGTSTLYTDPEMQALTIELWQYISSRYKNRSVVAAYSLLAEPMSAPSEDAMMQMYDRIYQAIRAQGDAHLMVIHDGFFGLGKMKSPRAMGWRDVIYSTHLFEWGISTHAEYRAYTKAIAVAFSLTQRRQQVPYYIGSFSTMVNEDWAYQGLQDYLDTFDAQGWSWTMWTYKRIDDPLELELWGTTTAWAVWQSIQEDSDWKRADVYLDGKAGLEQNLARYRIDRMVRNERLYTQLYNHLHKTTRLQRGKVRGP